MDDESHMASKLAQVLDKEEFVSNLTGGTLGEIFVVTIIPVVSYGLWIMLQRRFYLFDGSAKSFIIDSMISMYVCYIVLISCNKDETFFFE